MKVVPIVFCFDDNLILAAGVSLSSLLAHANEDTFYDIFILHDAQCKFPTTGYLEQLNNSYSNFKITYRSIGKAFEGAFEIRSITIATYYRLLIPEVILEYDKVMYHDVDVIFRDDLSSIFFDTNMDGYYVAGVSTPYSDIADYVKKNIGIESTQYIAAGNMILNSLAMRKDNIVKQFRETAKGQWKYQDMDVINIVCKGRVKYLPPSFCIVGTTCEILSNPDQPYYSKEEAKYALEKGILHYSGPKPWQSWCYNFDIWWFYYRASVYFDPKFYFDFYHSKYNEYDQLSFWKRVKILLRYFKTHI